jgi:hypothetical protein
MGAQNLAIALLWLLWLAVLVRRRLVLRFSAFALFCLASVLYSATFSGESLGLNVAMMLGRVAVLAELLYVGLRHRGVLQRWLLGASAVGIAAAAVLIAGHELPAEYLTIRHGIAAGTVLALTVLIAADRTIDLGMDRTERAHLCVLALHFASRAPQSLGYIFYESDSAWLIAGWIYAGCLAACVLLYSVFVRPQRRELFRYRIDPAQQILDR